MKKKIIIFLSFLLIISSTCFASNNKTLSPPVQIIYKNNSVIITDDEIRNKNNGETKYLIIKSKKYNFIPILVAIIAMLSSLYLAFINSKLTKNRDWHDKFSEKILNINSNIYDLTGKILQENSESEKYKLEIELRKIKSQLGALLDDTSEIDTYINKIEKLLEGDKSYKDRKELFEIVDELSSSLTRAIKK